MSKPVLHGPIQVAGHSIDDEDDCCGCLMLVWSNDKGTYEARCNECDEFFCDMGG